MLVLVIFWLVFVAVTLAGHQPLCICNEKRKRRRKYKGYMAESIVSPLSAPTKPPESNESKISTTLKVTECTQKLAEKNEEGKTEFTQNSFCLTPISIDQPKKPNISPVQNSKARKADVSHTQHSKEDEILDVKGTRKKRITAQNQEEARTQQFLDEISTNGTTQDRTADTASSIEKAVKNIELNEITQNTLLTQEDRDARAR